MAYLVIEDVKPWDGRYELDLDTAELTRREWGWIKRHSGYLPMTIGEGFDGGDPALIACLAVIALHRAGKITVDDVGGVFERLEDTPAMSTIRMEGDTAADDEDVPDPPVSSNGSAHTSGPASSESSETLVKPPNDPGTPSSATSEWTLPRSAT
jgi:hypothetical protein